MKNYGDSFLQVFKSKITEKILSHFVVKVPCWSKNLANLMQILLDLLKYRNQDNISIYSFAGVFLSRTKETIVNKFTFNILKLDYDCGRGFLEDTARRPKRKMCL